MDVGKFNGHTLYTGLRLDSRLRLWAAKSASHAASAVAELLLLVVTAAAAVLHFASLMFFLLLYFILAIFSCATGVCTN